MLTGGESSATQGGQQALSWLQPAKEGSQPPAALSKPRGQQALGLLHQPKGAARTELALASQRGSSPLAGFSQPKGQLAFGLLEQAKGVSRLELASASQRGSWP